MLYHRIITQPSLVDAFNRHVPSNPVTVIQVNRATQKETNKKRKWPWNYE